MTGCATPTSQPWMANGPTAPAGYQVTDKQAAISVSPSTCWSATSRETVPFRVPMFVNCDPRSGGTLATALIRSSPTSMATAALRCGTSDHSVTPSERRCPGPRSGRHETGCPPLPVARDRPRSSGRRATSSTSWNPHRGRCERGGAGRVLRTESVLRFSLPRNGYVI